MRFQAQRGTEDVLPADSFRWQRIEQLFRELTHRYGYRELRTPTFEDTQLFLRSAGDTSDIVTKQMYNFLDKGGRDITLKPEGTAPSLRALIEAGLLQQGQPTRVSYITPIFRYERPQKGRLREAHQVGFELIGSSSVEADAEVIEITVRFYQALGLSHLNVLINSIGRDACRQRYRDTLLNHAQSYLSTLDMESRAKIEKNPLRLVDSKDPQVADLIASAPSILDFLEDECKIRFEQLQQSLSMAQIPFRVSPTIVRGLDYYTETVFEVQAENIGAQSALCGGGRYDKLVKELGGPDMPSVGVAMGVERALLVLEAEGIRWDAPRPDAFIAYASEAEFPFAIETARRLRSEGLSCVMDYDGKSLKSQLKQADRSEARFTIVLGESEMAAQSYTLRNMATSEQQLVGWEMLMQSLKNPS
jgi:histidyl-tRNA synthetase